jgi:hypothetical protein
MGFKASIDQWELLSQTSIATGISADRLIQSIISGREALKVTNSTI